MKELKLWLKAFKEAIIEIYKIWYWGLQIPLIGIFFFYAMLIVLLLLAVIGVEIYRLIFGV